MATNKTKQRSNYTIKDFKNKKRKKIINLIKKFLML